MKRAQAVWEATGDDSALPHPSYTFSSYGVEYEVESAARDYFNLQYKMAYQKYLYENSKTWDIMSDKEKLEVLKDAHEKGRDAAKAWYKKLYGIK